MLFKRKNEFKPDREDSGALSKLYVTPKQRRALLKWVLMAALLTAVCVVQDVILCQVTLFGASFDLVSAVILLACILQDPEEGSIFALAASALYWFSGSAPGPYVILLLTALGVYFGILRHCYLSEGFGPTFLCAAVALLAYELLLFSIGVFLGYTTVKYLMGFVTSGLISAAVMPLIFPVLTAICKIGGETWNE